MPTPEGFNGDSIDPTVDPVISDYSFAGHMGYHYGFGNEYVIAQQREDGYTLAWTTDKNAADVIADYLVMGTDGMSTTQGGYPPNMCKDSVGGEILTDLNLLGDACFWAKLRKEGEDDYIVFNSRVIAGADRNDVAVMGPLIDREDTEHIARIKTAIEASATPIVSIRVDWLLQKVMDVIAEKAA